MGPWSGLIVWHSAMKWIKLTQRCLLLHSGKQESYWNQLVFFNDVIRAEKIYFSGSVPGDDSYPKFTFRFAVDARNSLNCSKHFVIFNSFLYISLINSKQIVKNWKNGTLHFFLLCFWALSIFGLVRIVVIPLSSPHARPSVRVYQRRSHFADFR